MYFINYDLNSDNMIASSSEYVSSFQLMILRYDGHVLIEYVRNYLMSILKQKRYCFSYHNLHRAELIIDTINELAGHYKVNEENYVSLIISVYLVEYGHVKNPLEPYKQSVATGIQLLKRRASVSLIRKIQSCIRAIRNPSHAKDIVERLFCDASLAHWGKIAFQQQFEHIREEYDSSLERKLAESNGR